MARHVFALLVLSSVLAACGAPGTRVQFALLPTAHVFSPTPAPDRVLLPTFTPAPTPPPPSPPPPSPPPDHALTLQIAAQAIAPDVAALEAAMFMIINDIRAQNGLPPYEYAADLSAVARAHSCDLAAHGMISHVSSDGRTLRDRVLPPWVWPSESIAVSYDDPALAVAMWMDEPPEGWHRRNILDPDQRAVGIGYCYAENDPSGIYHYWTADFSRVGE